MNKLLNNKALQDIFIKDFPKVNVQYQLVEFGGGIHIFLLEFTNEYDLTADWRKISNAIAVYFQSKIKDDFGKWNTYVFYRTNFEPSDNYRNLKYKIEKDIFSSRKIIIEEDKGLDVIIDEHILSKNLNIDEVKSTANLDEIFQKNEIITNALKNKTVREKKVKKEVALSVLDDLYNLLREENNEI